MKVIRHIEGWLNVASNCFHFASFQSVDSRAVWSHAQTPRQERNDWIIDQGARYGTVWRLAPSFGSVRHTRATVRTGFFPEDIRDRSLEIALDFWSFFSLLKFLQYGSPATKFLGNRGDFFHFRFSRIDNHCRGTAGLSFRLC